MKIFNTVGTLCVCSCRFFLQNVKYMPQEKKSRTKLEHTFLNSFKADAPSFLITSPSLCSDVTSIAIN